MESCIGRSKLSKAHFDEGEIIFQLVRATSFLRVLKAAGRAQIEKILGIETGDKPLPGADAIVALEDLKNSVAKDQEPRSRQNWLERAGKPGFFETTDSRACGA